MLFVKKMFFAFFTVAIALSCKSNDPNHIEQDKKFDEVMVIHDEVMPRMGEIHKLGKELKKLVENNTIEDDSIIIEIRNTIDYLESADEGMMEWMHNINKNKPSKVRKNKTHEEILSMLHEEMKKVEKVKYDINTSISNAQELLTAHKN